MGGKIPPRFSGEVGVRLPLVPLASQERGRGEVSISKRSHCEQFFEANSNEAVFLFFLIPPRLTGEGQG